MPIDISKERLRTLTQAAREDVPRRRRGKPTHASTLFRWARNGLRGVRLEVIRVGGTLCTSTEALQRFFDTLTSNESIGKTTSPTSSTDEIDSDGVAQRLDELGF